MVEGLGMAREDDCMREMFALIGFAGRRLGVPLARLDPVRPDRAAREALEDWRDVVAMRCGS